MKTSTRYRGAARSGGKAVMSLAAGLLLLGGPTLAHAQTPEESSDRVVNVLQEPRHRTVHRDGDVYLLDVQINPGDTSLSHTHDAAILLTYISLGNGPAGGRVSANTDYVTEPDTHQVSNSGPALMRIIALTNLGPPIEGMGDRATGLSAEPQIENEWFRSYRIDLDPGGMTSAQEHGNPTVVVQVSEGTVHVTREDGITRELTAPGDWAWRDAGSSFAVHNMGPEPVSVVVNEARRAGAD